AQSWSPTVTNVTLGNGSQSAIYTKLGHFVACTYRLVFGTTTAISGDVGVTLPATAFAQRMVAGDALFEDASTPANRADGVVIQLASSTQVLIRRAAATSLSASVPFTWAVNDVLTASWFYFANA